MRKWRAVEFFRVEQLQLRFSNGVERTYERLRGKAGGLGAVMIVAMTDAEHVVLVEEYCAGSDAYELSLPKGLIDPERMRCKRPTANCKKRRVLLRVLWS